MFFEFKKKKVRKCLIYFWVKERKDRYLMRHIPEIVILFTELESLENYSLDVENSLSSILTFI